MVGRKEEIKRIEQLLQSERSEFLAVTGRRRVGKTYLIDSLLKDHYCFSMTGIQNGSIGIQLFNFSVKLAEYEGSQKLVAATPEPCTSYNSRILCRNTTARYAKREAASIA